MEKKANISALLWFVASLLAYATAIVGFMSESGMVAVHLCLGSAFLCLGAVWLKKDNDSDKRSK